MTAGPNNALETSLLSAAGETAAPTSRALDGGGACGAGRRRRRRTPWEMRGAENRLTDRERKRWIFICNVSQGQKGLSRWSKMIKWISFIFNPQKGIIAGDHGFIMAFGRIPNAG